MDSGNSKPARCWLLRAILTIAFAALLVAIAVPNFVGGGPSKISGVINVLRQIDGAKSEWAFEHGLTYTASFSREISQEDIASLLKCREDHFDRFGFGFDKNGNPHGVQGVVFVVNPLGISPEARFTKNFRLDNKEWFGGARIPKGTILKFGTNTEACSEEYILPGKESKPCKSLSEVLAR